MFGRLNSPFRNLPTECQECGETDRDSLNVTGEGEVICEDCLFERACDELMGLGDESSASE